MNDAKAALPAPPPQAPLIGMAKIINPDKATLWGFQDDVGDDSGVYFYGASGTGNFDRGNSKRYSDAVGHDFVQETVAPAAVETPPQICSFYISGCCRFGEACRNIHSTSVDREGVPVDVRCNSNEADEAQLLAAEREAARVAECGICLSSLEDRTRGMLSHCSCIFCMDCIRSWRKDGVEIAKSSQVR